MIDTTHIHRINCEHSPWLSRFTKRMTWVAIHRQLLGVFFLLLLPLRLSNGCWGGIFFEAVDPRLRLGSPAPPISTTRLMQATSCPAENCKGILDLIQTYDIQPFLFHFCSYSCNLILNLIFRIKPFS